jgi:hypothetical protein
VHVLSVNFATTTNHETLHLSPSPGIGDIARLANESALMTTFARTALFSFTAAIALGATPLGYPAIAGADPNNGNGPGGEWDIGVYDSCMKNHPPFYSDDDKLDWAINCCYTSGGVWSSGGRCVAPSAATTTSSPLGPPARVVPPNMAPPLPPPPPNMSNLPAG